mgnify:CR=1 FL=1
MSSIDAAEPRHPPAIAWRVLLGLGLLEMVIRIGWSVYGQMQPSLLERFQLAHLIPSLLVLQGALGLVMEPLSGGFSDEQARRMGSRWSLIAGGIGAAVLLFLLTAITLRLDVLHHLALRGVPVFNSARAIEHTVDKARTSLLLAHHGIPTPPAFVSDSLARTTAYVEAALARGAILVKKPLFGSQALGQT